MSAAVEIPLAEIEHELFAPVAAAIEAAACSRSSNRLARTTLRTSRLLDFASEKELVAQTGHKPADWPLVILKEPFDKKQAFRFGAAGAF